MVMVALFVVDKKSVYIDSCITREGRPLVES